MSFLVQLNLTPQERRIVVGIAVVVFVVLNMFLVWPHFSDLARVRRQLEDTRKTMQIWNKEISLDREPTKGYKTELAQLERRQGGAVLSKQIQLMSTIRRQASRSGVNVNSYNSLTPAQTTNGFFEEQSEKITFDSQEAQLVAFLYNVGNDPSMIRIKELDLRPADPNRYRLQGDVILSAKYLKQPAVVVVSKPLPPGVKPEGAKHPGASAPSRGSPPVMGSRPLSGARPFSTSRPLPPQPAR